MAELHQPPLITGTRMVTTGRPVKPYVYRGTQFEPVRDPKKKPKPRRPAECGTDSGYRRHGRHGEDACQRCKDAHTKAQREWNERRKLKAEAAQ